MNSLDYPETWQDYLQLFICMGSGAMLWAVFWPLIRQSKLMEWSGIPDEERKRAARYRELRLHEERSMFFYNIERSHDALWERFQRALAKRGLRCPTYNPTEWLSARQPSHLQHHQDDRPSESVEHQ
ncbi:MAG: hypothetical protein ACOYMI_11195 [Phycisphaerales bacterium]